MIKEYKIDSPITYIKNKPIDQLLALVMAIIAFISFWFIPKICFLATFAISLLVGIVTFAISFFVYVQGGKIELKTNELHKSVKTSEQVQKIIASKRGQEFLALVWIESKDPVQVDDDGELIRIPRGLLSKFLAE